ncbi:MAG: hypothetical protein ACP6IP_04675 [Candidatus Njordarchaeia archaeon]
MDSGNFARKIAEIRSDVYASRSILKDKKEIRDKLNLTMSLIKSISYMSLCNLEEKMPSIYNDIKSACMRVLSSVEADINKLEEAERTLLNRIVKYLKEPKYRTIVTLMTKTPDDERTVENDKFFR